jgi:DNA-binding response OmpR family regulator
MTRENVRLAPPVARGATVLLVVHEEVLALTLLRIIVAGGYQVVHATSGKAALKNLRIRSFEAVLCDLNLPDSSGVDVLKVARAHDPNVPLLLMSGGGTVDTTIEAIELGVEYLVKPTTKDELLRVVHRATSTYLATPKPRPERAARAVAEPRAALAAKATKAASTLDAKFDRALRSLTVVLEPILHGTTGKLMGFTPRTQSMELAMATEVALLVAAERLDRVKQLRSRMLELALRAFVEAPSDALLFVDVRPSELFDDDDVYASKPLWSTLADRVVFQVRAGELGFRRRELTEPCDTRVMTIAGPPPDLSRSNRK